MVVRGNIDKDYFADGRPDLVENGVEIDVEAIARALVNIYQERIDIEHDIDDGLYRETLRIIKDAVDNGYADAIEAGTPAPDEEFRDAFEHSAEVFSAFRVHRMQNDIAAQMIDSSGKVKPFREFVRDVSSYIDHQNRAWLQTEYNTAILRAQNAAEWKQFQEEKDVYPNLEWIRSTSPNPGADHVPFWGTVLPVDDPFWDEHKPGDRWNCKCELRQTDKNSTSVPHSDGSSDAARGLESNPAKAREVFSDRHPYYPSSCVSCPFSGNKLLALFHDLAGGKHCHNCGRVDRVTSRTSVKARKKEYNGYGKGFIKTYFNRDNGGYVVTDALRKREQGSASKQEIAIYKKEKNMCIVFAKAGHTIVHRSAKSGDLTYDVIIDGQPADLKRTRSHNNMQKYASHATHDQGAKLVLFQFDAFTSEMQRELERLQRRGIHGMYFITGKENEVVSF